MGRYSREVAALSRYQTKIARMTFGELVKERGRLGSIRRNPANKATMIEAKIAAVDDEIRRR